MVQRLLREGVLEVFEAARLRGVRHELLDDLAVERVEHLEPHDLLELLRLLGVVGRRELQRQHRRVRVVLREGHERRDRLRPLDLALLEDGASVVVNIKREHPLPPAGARLRVRVRRATRGAAAAGEKREGSVVRRRLRGELLAAQVRLGKTHLSRSAHAFL